MSENLDELLGIADENEGDYDLGDDEEAALLDEDYDLPNKSQSTVSGAQATVETEDILELDDESELNDEDNLNSTAEEESRCDKFASERVVPQTEQKQQQKIFVKKFKLRKNIPTKQSFHGNFSNTAIRGKRIGYRGNYHNTQMDTVQYHQRNKVLINPHFKGNVQIKHNVSLAWDKNNTNNNTMHKKPVIHIQPWAHHRNPQKVQYQRNPQNVQYQQNPVCPDVFINQQCQVPVQNTRLPVHQRLGINSNIYNNETLPDNQSQYVQNFQQPPFQQQVFPLNQYSQPPVYSQSQFGNNYNNQQMNQYPQPIYNNVNVNKPINPPFQSQNVYPPINQFQQPMPPPPHHNYNQNQSYLNYHTQNSQQPEFIHNFSKPPPNIVNYPPNVPVVSNEILSVDVPYFEEPEQKYQRPRHFSGGSPGKRKFDFKQDLRRKRSVLPSNLHEVKTVDVDVDVKVFQDTNTTMFEDKDDEVTYRNKIENQKRMRERLLRQKEERRRQTARLLQTEEENQDELPTIDIQTPTTNIIELAPQTTNLIKKTQVLCVNKTIVPIKTIDNSLAIKRVVTTKPLSCENVSAENHESETLNKDQLTSFLSNRKIFAKDKSLIDTSLVVVNNLATGTTEVKLRKLCQGVGDIQNLQMSTQERQATIQFKSVASAHAFYKKYQRFMLDLSMIQVTLKPLPQA